MLKLIMSKKSLIKTNPYLKNPQQREELLYTSVSSSTAIEGVLTTDAYDKKTLKKKKKYPIDSGSE